MNWLYLALLAYFINAFVFVIDKHLLARTIPKHNAYAFGVATLSSFAIFLVPLGVSWQSTNFFLIAIACGVSTFLGLVYFYRAMSQSDVSITATQVGSIGAVATYFFSILLLKDSLPLFNLLAFLFLILGILSLGKIAKHILFTAVLAGIFFGLSTVFLKLAFNLSDFVNGLFWTRMAFVGSALTSLISPRMRQEVGLSYRQAPQKSKFLFVFNKILATFGFVALYFAIKLGNVTIVNAMLGAQFMFIFFLALILRNKIPGISEKLNKEILTYKLAGIIFVLLGLIFLFNQ